MNILTLYFSGTGNTKWVISQLDIMLKKNGHKSTFLAIEDMDVDKHVSDVINDIDYIGFAYPLYGANIPRIMQTYIDKFIDDFKNNKSITSKLFFINTFAYVNGHGIFEAKKIFNNVPFKIVSYVNIKMPNSAPMKNNKKLTNKETFDEKTIINANKKLSKLIKHLKNSRNYINGIGPHLFVGKLIRRILCNELKNNYKNMHVDMNSCIKCMKCLKNCPVKCIHYKNNEFTFSKDCEACMRCYHGCPTHAISNIKKK